MPLSPDVVAEFVIAPLPCLPDDKLSQLTKPLSANFLPSLEADRKTSRAVCAFHPVVKTNVVTVGMWIDLEDEPTEAELRAALLDSSSLTPGRTIALLVTARVIKLQAAEKWAEIGEKIDGWKFGPATLDEEISVLLEVGSNRIVTEFSGTYDPGWWFPAVDFTYTISDSLSLRPPGSAPPVEARTSRDIDVPALIQAALIIFPFSPLFGTILFFGHEPIAEAQAPEYPGVGALLAYQWPPEILIPPIPEVFEKPSKFLLSWSDLTVDEGGVRTLGTFTPTERAPRVSILGPREVPFREATQIAVARYTARHRDLRAPLTTQWSGDASGSKVLFTSPGQKTIRVSVSDADNLSAVDEITVHVSVIPLEGSQQPF